MLARLLDRLIGCQHPSAALAVHDTPPPLPGEYSALRCAHEAHCARCGAIVTLPIRPVRRTVLPAHSFGVVVSVCRVQDAAVPR